MLIDNLRNSSYHTKVEFARPVGKLNVALHINRIVALANSGVYPGI